MLLNRRCFENRIKNIKRNCVFLFIDFDKFKEINDTYGHNEGDRVLKEIALITLETFNQYGKTYRIGGDEYCVIIKKEIHKVEILIANLQENIAIKREEYPLLPNVSIGYGSYYNGKNTVKDALCNADAMMYQKKKKHQIAKLEFKK